MHRDQEIHLSQALSDSIKKMNRSFFPPKNITCKFLLMQVAYNKVELLGVFGEVDN